MTRNDLDEKGFPPCTEAMFSILLVLADHEAHGYAIMQEVAAQTDGAMRLAPGTLYRSIKLLLTGGMIAECDERPDPALDDERRRYYRITEAGMQVAEHEARRLAGLVRVAHARRLLRGDVPAVLGGTE